MLDQSLLQSHFIGRDGFRWWIGQIPPIESMGKQITGGGWGNRFKVRIIGYHPYSEAELPNEDLPWAQCLVPTTAGTGAANCSTGVQLQPGDVVLGFFLDGDNAQIPVILAAFGRTSSVPSKTFKSPFEAFTGYSKPVSSVPKTAKSESSENRDDSQKSPRDVSPAQARIIGPDEIPTSDAIGTVVVLADPVGNTRVSAIKSEVKNLLSKIETFAGDVERIRSEISRVVDTITSITNDFVGVGFNFLYKTLTPILQDALKLLYDTVFAEVLASTGNPAIAHLAGVAAQTAMGIPVKVLEDSIFEVANQIVNVSIKGFVNDLLTSTIGNIDRFTLPVEAQFTATLLNSIVDLIDTGMQSPLAGVEKLLQFFPGFSVADTLRSSINAIQSIGAAFDTNQSKDSFQGLITEWMIGANPIDVTTNSFQKILDSMNVQSSGSKSTKPVNTPSNEGINLGNLYTTIKLTESVNTVDGLFRIERNEVLIQDSILSPASEEFTELIFVNTISPRRNSIRVKRQYAGISSAYPLGQEFYAFSANVSASKIKTNLVPDQNLIADYTKTISALDTKKPKYAPPPTVKIFGGKGKGAEAVPLMGNFVTDGNGFTTGSIIGFEITNSGSGYSIPPFVEIVDDIDSPQGYGVAARAVVKNGKVSGIYVISEGENYTLNDKKDFSVSQVIIENSGTGYDKNTTVSDQFNNNYPVRIFEGKIIQIDTLNNRVTDKPVLTINSENGSGAILRPIVGQLIQTTKRVTKVVDCPI